MSRGNHASCWVPAQYPETWPVRFHLRYSWPVERTRRRLGVLIRYLSQYPDGTLPGYLPYGASLAGRWPSLQAVSRVEPASFLLCSALLCSCCSVLASSQPRLVASPLTPASNIPPCRAKPSLLLLTHGLVPRASTQLFVCPSRAPQPASLRSLSETFCTRCRTAFDSYSFRAPLATPCLSDPAGRLDAEARVVLRLCAPLCSHLLSLVMPAMALSMTQAALAGPQKHRACDECRKSP